MMAVSVNFRDTLIAAGKNFRGAVPEDTIPLSDGAGVVEVVGDGVSAWRPGDRVSSTFMPRWLAGGITREKAASVTGTTIDGVLTQWKVFNADEIVRIPDYLSWEEAATLPCTALTAWSVLNGPVPVRAGESVVVLGTGGVALFTAQFASAMGARVIITSSSQSKLERALTLGATDAINYADNPRWHESVLKLTDSNGADHVVETHGPATFETSIASCRMGGQVHVVGTQRNAQIDGSAILRARICLRSVTVGSHEAYYQMNCCLTQHQIRPVIDRTFAFEEAQDAFA